ncbi:MAG: hypothetical protein KF823_12755 [Xanthomonadales bacterium]|nr:hypothetical protein [Xanthomonadales bacterium]
MKNLLASTLVAGLLALGSAPGAAQAQGNPLDHVGIEHNVYLACLMHNGATQGVQPLVAVVNICGFDPGMSTAAFVERYEDFAQIDPYAGAVQGMLPYREAFTDAEFAWFAQIDNVLETAPDFATADAAFAQLEAAAVAQLRLGTPPQQSILAGLSVARHSLRFWSARERTSGSGTDDSAASSLRLRPIWKVLLVVGADLVGGAGGTLIGGPGLGGVLGAASSGGAADVLSP